MSTQSFPIAIVVSRFNTDVTGLLKTRALKQLSTRGFKEKDITVIEVPGAIEIPFVVNRLAKTKRYEAIVCYGAVVRGETGHYDFVCAQVSEGCQRVMLDYDLPVIFGLLTTDNQAQALARADGTKKDTGSWCIDAAIEMVELSRSLNHL